MIYECPVCHAELKHTFNDEIEKQHIIHKDGSIERILDDSNGCGSIQCTADPEHEIPNKLFDQIMELIGAFEKDGT